MIFNDPWGYSKLQTYEECPRKFAFQYINKLSQPSSPALERGSRIHASCEAYINGWDKVIDPDLEKWEEQLDELKAKSPKTEQAWGFDQDWNLLSDWFQPATWLRAKADAIYRAGDVLTVIDFKTGKYKVPPEAQIELYAICGLAVYPDAETVRTEYWFIDSGNVLSKEYTRPHLLELRSKYAVIPMYTDTEFNPLPSRSCAYCSYSRQKGGQCDAG